MDIPKAIISSKQIYFRPIDINDIENGWLQWVNDHSATKYLTYKKPARKQDLIDYLNDAQPPSTYMFAICLQNDDQYIGNAKLGNINWVNRHAEYGRLIGDANLRGRGIGTEVLMLLSYYAFYRLNLNRIHTGVISKNIPSVRSNEKAGAIQEGVLREYEYVEGIYEDVIRFGILKSDFDKTNWREIVCQN